MATYAVGNRLTLMCVLDSSVNTTGISETYSWQCDGCFADGLTGMVIMRTLTDMDSGVINCSVNVDGNIMIGTFDLRVTEGNHKRNKEESGLIGIRNKTGNY